MDEYAVQRLPGYKPMTKKEIEDLFREMGATDENLQERIDEWNRAEEALLGPGGPGFRVIGVSLIFLMNCKKAAS